MPIQTYINTTFPQKKFYRVAEKNSPRSLEILSAVMLIACLLVLSFAIGL